MNSFPKIGLLITHYNRSRSLENLLRSLDDIDCRFGSIVVSDDGSLPGHLTFIKNLQNEFSFQLVEAPENRGLGNNINKGQDAIKQPFTLYIQEDFEPNALFLERLKDALGFLEKDNELDIVRFYAYKMYPYLKPFEKGFSRMYIKPLATNYKKIHYYSDHPHLRRTTFFEKFGRYVEGLQVEETEYRMSIAFIQKKGKGLFYNDIFGLFEQKNSTEEPSTVERIARNKSNFVQKVRRYLYRQVKYNVDILSMDPSKID